MGKAYRNSNFKSVFKHSKPRKLSAFIVIAFRTVFDLSPECSILICDYKPWGLIYLEVWPDRIAYKEL